MRSRTSARLFAAAREGDLDALAAVLDPEVVARADWGGIPAGAVGFTVRHDMIVEIDVLLDPARLRHLTNRTDSQSDRS